MFESLRTSSVEIKNSPLPSKMLVGQVWENCARVFSPVCTKEVAVKFILMEFDYRFMERILKERIEK